MKNIIKTSIFLLAISFFIASVANAQTVITTVNIDADSVRVGANETVNWQTSNFPEDGTVNINLIRKVSDSPVEYTLVRQLSVNTPNDGTETWKPERGDVGQDYAIEVTCAGTSDFEEGCVSKADGQTFAVKNSFSSSLANVFDAIKNFFSKIF